MSQNELLLFHIGAYQDRRREVIATINLIDSRILRFRSAEINTTADELADLQRQLTEIEHLLTNNPLSLTPQL